MKVCIPCTDPGGPDSVIATRFEETDLLDHYDVDADGRFEHTAQIRNCGGATCVDPIDAIIGRGVDAVIITGLTPDSLMRFHQGSVRVLMTADPSVRATLDALARNELEEITIDQFARLEKCRK
ncbi:MAG: NifB/NifX family molybdenum-iron cluster-binding protein [Thermoplasmata archaeon]|nr:NifB/NifX family molybdenum-iron cluster-binding protein [Thermoplasmata archaeon]MCJ7562526.1 hypothetical protein [Thermoplasmata archaeon]TFG69010.1 MAG: hypothetical protein E4H25_05170 [Methanomassiliicoccus sp.]